MSEHWNIQINIQHVRQVPGTRLAGQSDRKESTEALKLAITAETEAEAYEKAHRMLVANHPDVVVVRPGEEVPTALQQQFTSLPYDTPLKRPIRDNPQA